MIKIIDCLYLTEDGCSIKNRSYQPVHIRQGDIDGACAVYALMMNLLILRTIHRRQLDDVFNRIKTSPEVERLFHELFDKHGLVRGGLLFEDLERMTNRAFGMVVTATSYDEDCEAAEDGFIEQIHQTLDLDRPIILGIDFKGGGGHAVLAIGYERDAEGLFNIFCLDPGYDCKPTSYWNMVISLYRYRGLYKHQCLTENPYNCPAIKISDTLIVTKK